MQVEEVITSRDEASSNSYLCFESNAFEVKPLYRAVRVLTGNHAAE
jgi:hypothetical protein